MRKPHGGGLAPLARSSPGPSAPSLHFKRRLRSLPCRRAVPELPQVSRALLVDLRCPGEFSALLQEPGSKLCAPGDASGLQYRFFHLLARREDTKKPQTLSDYF